MVNEPNSLVTTAAPPQSTTEQTVFKRFDTAVRRALCAKFDHKFFVGSGGYYPGLPQNRCWRCGRLLDTAENRIRQLPEYAEPIGGWLK